MSSRIQGEALAELMRVNCTREYAELVVGTLERALRQRDNTMQTIFEVIDELNKLQPKLNILQIATFLLDAAFTIGYLASLFGTVVGCAAGPSVIAGAKYVIKNNICNRVIRKLRDAMMEDKRARDNLQTLLHQELGCALPDVIEFESKRDGVHEVFLFISKYVTKDCIDWIKHLENIGIVGIIPVGPSSSQQAATQDATTQPSNKWIKYAFGIIMKSISAIKILPFVVGKTFVVVIEKIVHLLYHLWGTLVKCSNAVLAKCHPTSKILETSYVPELMHDTEIMLTLLEKLKKNNALDYEN